MKHPTDEGNGNGMEIYRVVPYEVYYGSALTITITTLIYLIIIIIIIIFKK